MTDFLTRREAGDYLKQRGAPWGEAALAKLACSGEGPLFRRAGRRVLYTRHDLDAWLAERMSQPAKSTTEHDAGRPAA